MIDFLLDPVGEIARKSIAVNILTEAAKRKMDQKTVVLCDLLCPYVAEASLGSGKLCSYHYHRFFPDTAEPNLITNNPTVSK